jgi:TRAP-type C4-dicarboxylate transport system permease small subunit
VTPKHRIDRAAEAAGRLASLLFVVIVAITAYEVLMRYVFSAPTSWVHEITVFLAAAAFVAGGPAAHAGRAHIAITVLPDRMSPRWRARVRVLQDVLTLAFLGLLTFAAARQAEVSVRDLETSGTALNLPTPVLLKALFVLACAVLFVQTVGHLRADLAALGAERGRR